MRFILFIFLAGFYSCNRTPVDNSTLPTSTQSEISNPDTNEIRINAAYPFGSPVLTTLKYPKHWDEDRDNYGTLKAPDDTVFYNISSTLQQIHNAQTIPGPQVDSLEFLNLNKRYKGDSYYFDTIAVKSLDSCVYRLPDIGNYECYYYRQHSTKITYGVYGSLLLLEPTKRTGKLLTLYFEYGGEQNVNIRYYLVDRNTIKLYDGVAYDDGTTLRESFVIILGTNGELDVQELVQ